ncbi:MAG: signal peptidase I [Candidatus Hydrothermarchaeota archaeon]
MKYAPHIFFILIISFTSVAFSQSISVSSSYPDFIAQGDKGVVLLTIKNDFDKPREVSIFIHTSAFDVIGHNPVNFTILPMTTKSVPFVLTPVKEPGYYKVDVIISVDNKIKGQEFYIEIRKPMMVINFPRIAIFILFIFAFYLVLAFLRGESLRKEFNELVKSLVFALALYFVLSSLLTYAFNSDTPIVAVASDSMVPTLNRGDVLFVKGGEDINEGDIIVYRSPVGNIPIIHRVIKVKDNQTYITKGDANPAPDPWEVKKSWVTGKVIMIDHRPLLIPWIGKLRLILSGL